MSKQSAAAVVTPTKFNVSLDGESIPVFLREYPELRKYLAGYANSPEKPRMPTFTIFFERGQCRVCFHDRMKNRSIFRTASDPMAGFAAINAALEAPKPDWRASRRAGR